MIGIPVTDYTTNDQLTNFSSR